MAEPPTQGFMMPPLRADFASQPPFKIISCLPFGFIIMVASLELGYSTLARLETMWN
jgi:hypothetical protein